MSGSPRYLSPKEFEAIFDAEREVVIRRYHGQIYDHLSIIDNPEHLDHPDTLSVVTLGLLMGGFVEGDVGTIVGRDRTTVGRWAMRKNLPRAPGERRAYNAVMLAHLKASAHGRVDISNVHLPSPKRRAKLMSVSFDN